MKVTCFTNGVYRQNAYVLTSAEHSLIVDPGSQWQQIVNLTGDTTVHAILNTHGHFDHIGAVMDLQEQLAVPFYIHSGDRKLLKRANLYQITFKSPDPIRIPKMDQTLDHDQELEWPQFHLKVLHTPGHTAGSCCLMINQCLFTGDMLLKGAVGSTDLPGGNAKQMKDSLQLLSELPENTVIYPGHGEPSTIGEELQSNQDYINILK